MCCYVLARRVPTPANKVDFRAPESVAQLNRIAVPTALCLMGPCVSEPIRRDSLRISEYLGIVRVRGKRLHTLQQSSNNGISKKLIAGSGYGRRSILPLHVRYHYPQLATRFKSHQSYLNHFQFLISRFQDVIDTVFNKVQIENMAKCGN